jgi:hypothetical protein
MARDYNKLTVTVAVIDSAFCTQTVRSGKTGIYLGA